MVLYSGQMISLAEICLFLDERFHSGTVRDYPNALNGLQLENAGSVARLGAAVDASESTIDMALDAGVDFLLVHHGLYWSGLRPLTGPFYRKVRKAMSGNMAVYSLHLPLDDYTEFGNSRLLAEAIGLKDMEPFFESMGFFMGAAGKWEGDLNSLVRAVSSAVGGSVQCIPGRGSDPGKVAIASGGSGDELEKMARLGAQTLIVGEGAHWTVPIAEELGINLLYAGHYATETFGVRALTGELSRHFSLPWQFLDNPTGR